MFSVVPQRRAFDCGVACISTLVAATYEDVFFVAAKVAGPKIREGLTLDQMIRIASRFKRTLRKIDHRKVDLEEDTGILSIRWSDRPRWADGHVVVLRRGVIIEPDSTIRVWDADEYLTRNKAKYGTLLSEVS